MRRFETHCIKYVRDKNPEWLKGTEWEEPDEWSDDYVNALFEFNGDTVRIVATDGGEPEDQTLGRDWSWVQTELNALLKEFPNHIGVLVNDGCEGNSIYNPIHLPFFCMMQRKSKAGECLATPGWHSERVYSFYSRCTFAALIRDAASDFIYGILDLEFLHAFFQPFYQLSPIVIFPVMSLRSSFWILEICRINTIRIDQTTEQKSHEKTRL